MTRRSELKKLLASTDLPCPCCKYNLRGLDQGRCPECGFGFDIQYVKAVMAPRARVFYWGFHHAFWLLLGVTFVISLIAISIAPDEHNWFFWLSGGSGGVRSAGLGVLGALALFVIAFAELCEDFGDRLWRDRLMLFAAGLSGIRILGVLSEAF